MNRSRLVALSAVLTALVAAPPATAKPPALRVTVAAPKPVQPGRWVAVKATVRNGTAVRLTGATLTVAPAAGVSAQLAGARRGRLRLALPAIRARGSRGVTVRLRAATTMRDGAATTVRVSAGRRRAAATVALRLAVDPNTLAGRWFWSAQFRAFQNLDVSGVYFVDARWAYRGLPEGGLPSCTAATAVGEDDGCVAYSYDASTGAVTLGGVAGTLTGTSLRVGDVSYSPLGIPAAGARLDGGGLHTYQVGLCPGSFCSISFTTLKLAGDGQFALSSAISGTYPGGSFGALPPDKHGTYAIGPAGRITFTYADGTVTARTIGILTDDAGLPNATEGIVLDGQVYIKDD